MTDFIFEGLLSNVDVNLNIVSVKPGNHWGIVDKSGNTTIPFIFQYIVCIDNDTAFAMYNGRYGILNVKATGHQLQQATTPTTPNERITVLVNGNVLIFDQQPIIENGRTMVPLRVIFEALGAVVKWEESTQTVTAIKDNLTITLQIGSYILVRNGERIQLDVPQFSSEEEQWYPFGQ